MTPTKRTVSSAIHIENGKYELQYDKILFTAGANTYSNCFSRLCLNLYRLCARDEVDMSSCAIMMSWAEAERRGISRDKMVFIHGSGDGFDANTISLRLIMKAYLCGSIQ